MIPTKLDDPDRTTLDFPSLRRSLCWSGLTFAVTLGLFTLIWAKYINPFYFPYGDSFSVLVNSLPPFHPVYSDWVLHGFRSYFDVYPDMSRHSTNFLRPVVNGTFFIGWFVYGSHWSRYLLTTYAIIGLIAATVCFLSSYILKLGWSISLLAVLCIVFAPSIDAGAMFDPTFAFDLLGGCLVLLAVTALISDKLLFAWGLLVLAIFTKETTLFAPPLAAIVVFVRKDDRRMLLRAAKSASFLLPIIAWAALRRHDFHGEKGLYVFMDSSTHGPIHVALVRIILGLASWPLASTVYWSKIPLLLQWLDKVTVLLNIAFWIALTTVLARYLLKVSVHPGKLIADRRAGSQMQPISIVSFFCAASLLMPLVLNIPRRFGGVFFPLFVLCLASAARYGRSKFIRVTSVGMVAAVGVTGALLIFANLQYRTRDLRFTWAMASNYISQLSVSKDPQIFSVDNLSGRYSSTEYVKKFSGYKGQLIRVNDMQWNFACSANTHYTVTSLSSGSAMITSFIPTQCGDHGFNSVFPPLDPDRSSFTRSLSPVELQYTLLHRSEGLDHINLNENELRVELRPSMPGSIILIANPANVRYERVLLTQGLNTSR